MKLETKPVSKVVLRDKILDQIKHEALYKTLREILPICCSSCRIEEVYPVGIRDVVVAVHHLLTHLRALVYL